MKPGFIHQILTIGTHAGLPQHIQKRVIPANVTSLVLLCTVAIPFIGISAWYMPTLVFIPVIGAFTTLGVFIAYALGGFTYARLVMATLPVWQVMIYNAYLCGPDDAPVSSLFVVSVGFLLTPFVKFDLKEKGLLITSLLLCTLAIVLFPWLKNLFVLDDDPVAVKEYVALLETGWLSYLTVGLAVLAVIGSTLGLSIISKNAENESLALRKEAEKDKEQLMSEKLRREEDLLQLRQAQTEENNRQWASEGMAKLSEILRSHLEGTQMYDAVLAMIIHYVQANQGGMYVVENEAGEINIKLSACYAYSRKKYKEQTFAPGQGLIGQCYLEADTLYMTDIPAGYVYITSGLGEATPRCLLLIPMKLNEVVEGVLELAAFYKFSPHQIAFLEKACESMASFIQSYRVNQQTKMLLEQAQQQAEQMRAHEEELRQNQEELQATQEEISRKYTSLFNQLTELNYESKFAQLKSITFTKKRNVEYYFDIIRNQILTFAENTMVVEAVQELKQAFYTIDENLSEAQLLAMKESLHKYYLQEFVPTLNDYTSNPASADQYLPQTVEATVLQALYIAQNLHPTGKKSMLDYAPDGSKYSKAHAMYHPLMRSFLEKFGYYDIFLIDSNTGDMLYSVFKEVDFATNLVTGLYASTNFGKVVKQVMESTDKHFVKLIDFEPYAPSYQAPASFIACPVYQNHEKIGILVFQMPVNKINQILTGNNNWIEDGLGESGETFIVGKDYKIRSISREFIENRAHYLSTLEKQGYEEAVIHQMEKSNTNLLLEQVRLEAVSKALQGVSGTHIERHKEEVVLNTFSPLHIPDVDWIIISTIKEQEASQSINNLRNV